MFSLHIGDADYDLTHLQTISREVGLELRGGVAKTIKVEFHFSNHGYSKGLSDGEVLLPEHLADGTRRRKFDRAASSKSPK